MISSDRYSFGQDGSKVRWPTLVAVFLVPLAVRLATTLLISVEADADGYYHALFAERAAKAISSGKLSFWDLHGFWLPLYHLAAGAISMIFGSAYWSCRILSVIAGAATCALVWSMVLRVFKSRIAAWGAWLLLVTAPWHILYSAFSMNEASFGFCIAAAVYCLSRAGKENSFFLFAAAASAAACLLRYEGWIIAPVIWLIAAGQRRSRIWMLCAGGILIVIPIAGVHVLNYMLEGNTFYHLDFQRANMTEYNALYPAVAMRNAFNIARHIGLLGMTSGPAALILALVGLWTILRDKVLRLAALPIWLVAAVQISFLMYSYLIGNSGSFGRYWVPSVWGIAALGGPGVAYVARRFGQSGYRWKKSAAAAGIVTALAVNGVLFFESAKWIFRQSKASTQISMELRKLYEARQISGLIYTEAPAVRFESGLPPQNFVDPGMPRERAKALEYLRENKIEYMVWLDTEYAPTRYAFPELAGGRESPGFKLCANPRLGNPEILLFRITSK